MTDIPPSISPTLPAYLMYLTYCIMQQATAAAEKSRAECIYGVRIILHYATLIPPHLYRLGWW